MSTGTKNRQQSGRVPIGVVLITVGFIVLLTVLGVWLVAPGLMPPGVYTAVSPYLAAIQPAAHLPTRVPSAQLPPPAATTAAATEILLPETAVSPTPSGLINANEVTKRDPYIGWPVRIEIPALELDAPIDQVGLTPVPGPDGETYFQWQVPDAYQAGWHFNSAMLGQTGNTVLNGHHNVFGEVFRDLIDLEPGDMVVLYDRNQPYYYAVTDKEILPERGQPLSVRLENARWIQSTEDERITLVTCWPYTDNSHRLVIVAKPVPEQGTEAEFPVSDKQ